MYILFNQGPNSMAEDFTVEDSTAELYLPTATAELFSKSRLCGGTYKMQTLRRMFSKKYSCGQL